MAVGLCAYASDDFAKAVTFTTSGYQGSAALANFPVLVKLSTSIEGFDYADFGGGRNIVFKDSAGNEIPHEIDTWDTSGTSLVWVKVPSLTAETTFTMFYCGSTASDIAPSCTWSGANYVGVWHMDEENGTVADASGHGLVATPTPDGGASASVRYSGVDAPVGYARQTGTTVEEAAAAVGGDQSVLVSRDTTGYPAALIEQIFATAETGTPQKYTSDEFDVLFVVRDLFEGEMADADYLAEYDTLLEGAAKDDFSARLALAADDAGYKVNDRAVQRYKVADVVA